MKSKKNKKKQEERVKFYSETDGTLISMLISAEKILTKSFVKENYSEINDIIELHNIKKLIDHDLLLKTWSEDTKTDFKKKVKQYASLIGTFFSKIDEESYIEYFEEVIFDYKDDFFEIINNQTVFKKITGETFIRALNKNEFLIRDILKFKNFVTHYDTLIRNFLLQYEENAELLLDEFYAEKDSNQKKMNFPKSLSKEDKSNIIEKYIDCESPNLNYLRLILEDKKNKELALNPKVILKAKKKGKVISNFYLQNNAIKINFDLEISNRKKDVVFLEGSGYSTHLIYNYDNLISQKNNIDRFHNFIFPFRFVDENFNFNFLANKTEDLSPEKFSKKTKKSYPRNTLFDCFKDSLPLNQLNMYENFVTKNFNTSIERIITDYINTHLTQTYGIPYLNYSPSTAHSFLEKTNHVAIQTETLLNKFQLYTKEGEIDPELLELTSSTLYFGKIKSLNPLKYAYLNSTKKNLAQTKKIQKDSIILFGKKCFQIKNQSLQSSCHNFIDTLSHKVKIDDFEDFSQKNIKDLIKDGYLRINKKGYLTKKDEIYIQILDEIYHKGYINIINHIKTHVPRIYSPIFEMINEGILEYDTCLFSKQEVDYLNYYLNDKSFSNSLGLRNKYIHGSITNNKDEKIHYSNYLKFLRILILVVIKIEDDLKLRKQLKEWDYE